MADVDVNALLEADIAEMSPLPTFELISKQCTRQMCRSAIITALAEQPGVEGISADTTALMLDEATQLIGEMMILVAKLYKEKGLPYKINADADTMKREEAARFGLVKLSEDEECQSPNQPGNKSLN